MVAPSGEGAVRCMKMAMATSKNKIDYINTHGTSTPVGDITELNAVKEAFGNEIPKISSTKSLSGHPLGPGNQGGPNAKACPGGPASGPRGTADRPTRQRRSNPWEQGTRRPLPPGIQAPGLERERWELDRRPRRSDRRTPRPQRVGSSTPGLANDGKAETAPERQASRKGHEASLPCRKQVTQRCFL